MVFIRDNTPFRREINDTTALVGSITPVSNLTAFSAQTIHAGGAGIVSKIISSVAGSKLGGAAAKSDGLLGTLAGWGGAAVGAVGVIAFDVTAAVQHWAGASTVFDNVYADGTNSGPIYFQFFPATISDSRSVDYNEVILPFVSNPVPTFVSPSPRTISFEAEFAQEKWVGPEGDGDSFRWDKHNFSVRLAVQVLRSFTYSVKGILPQPLLLTLPETRIGIDKDCIFCLMKSCNSSYKAFFPNGQPRVASVQLEFQEYVLATDTITRASFANVLNSYTSQIAEAVRSVPGTDLSADVSHPGQTIYNNSAGVDTRIPALKR